MRVRSLSLKRSFEVSLVVKQYVFILFHSFLQLKVALTITYTLSDKKLIDSYKAKMTCVIRTNWRTIIEGTVKDFWRHAMITVCFKAFVNSLTSFARFFEEKEKTKGKKKRKRNDRNNCNIQKFMVWTKTFMNKYHRVPSATSTFVILTIRSSFMKQCLQSLPQRN